MRRCITLLSVCGLALAPSSAFAAVSYKGFTWSPVGAATLDVDQNGGLDRLLLGNLGSSGQDGLTAICPHADGARFVLSGASSATDAGAVCDFSFTWALAANPAGAAADTRMTVGAGQVDFTFPPASLSSAATLHVVLTHQGRLLDAVDMPADGTVSVLDDSTGACPNPAFTCCIVRKVHGLHRGEHYAADVPVSVNGGAVVMADGIDVSCPLDAAAYGADGVEGDVRVTSPPGSSFAQLAFTDAACRVFGRFVAGDGAAALAVSAGTAGPRVLAIQGIGAAGADGFDLEAAPELALAGGAGADCAFAPPSLHFDPADEGAACGIMVRESPSKRSLGSTLAASLVLTISGSGFRLLADHSQFGADVESLVVYRHGVEVGRGTTQPDVPCSIAPPPGGSPDCRVVAAGLDSRGWSLQQALPAGPALASRPGASPNAVAAGVLEGDPDRPFVVDFDRDRVIVAGGVALTGDRVYVYGGCASGQCTTVPGPFIVLDQDCRLTAPAGSSLAGVQVLDFAGASLPDVVAAQLSGSSFVSSASSCVRVPFTFGRTDTTGVRGFSVTFHLSPELAICGAGALEGDYLSRVGGTSFQLVDNGGGSYTADCAILGPVCGATGGGTLFTIDVGAAGAEPGTSPPDGLGRIVTDAVVVRDCSNLPVPGDPGADALLPVDFTPPAALAGLATSRVKTGNPPGGTTGITVRWSAPELLASVALFRKGYGGYPSYASGGSTPAAPASPAAALASGWTPASLAVASSGSVDAPPARDFFYYVAFVTDPAGNASPPSALTAGTLDYHLGDVTDGATPGQGDDRVDVADVSLLGAYYGASVPPGSAIAFLDVGPTTDYSVDGRPLDDGIVDFEDLMMFAINYGQVSAPASAARPASLASDALRVSAPVPPAPGGTFDASLEMDGAGDAQGLRVRLAWDAAVVAPLSVAPGALLAAQGRGSAALSAGPGDVDVTLLGTGPGIAGSGVLATVTFRVLAPGDPALGIAGVSARDARNRAVPVTAASGGGPATRAGLALAGANPFRDAIAMRLTLAAAGPARVVVFDVAGRRVRTLLEGRLPAGTRSLAWDGRDDAGVRLAPGAYVIRGSAAGRDESREVRLVR